ncbi:MAG: hypothetical protein H6Q99_317 [Proteobacteria bacterium]|nr:hypothetical protein [Pseudomonadota bacterium]
MASVCFAPEGGAGDGGADPGADAGADAAGAGQAADAGKAAPAAGADAGGDKGKAAADAAAGAKGALENPALKPDAKAAPKIYRPDGLPDHLLGGTDQETIDKLFSQNKGFRDDTAKRGAVPRDATTYDLALSDDAKAAWKVADDDKAVGLIKEVAHEYGLTDKQAGVFGKFLDVAMERGIIPKPIAPDALFTSLAPADAAPGDAVSLGERRYLDAEVYLNTLGDTLGFSEDERRDTLMMATTKGGLRLIERMMRSAGVETSVTVEGRGKAGGEITPESLRARQADERNNRSSAKFDQSFQAETDRQYKAFYG